MPLPHCDEEMLMPYYMQQWSYKDDQVKKMILERQDREEVIRIITEAHEGTLENFYFCFGEYDGVAIAKYPNNETAMASFMTIYAQGRLRNYKTTVLFTPDENRAVIARAHALAQREP
jgi:uncharacterized protein with GYD domain